MNENVENLVLEQLKLIRREIADLRTLALQTVEHTRRIDRRMGEFDHRMGELDRRMGELRDDIELMVKAELMGRLGHFETVIEQQLGVLSDRLAALETR